MRINQTGQINYFGDEITVPDEKTLVSDAVTIQGGKQYRFSARYSADVISGAARFTVKINTDNGQEIPIVDAQVEVTPRTIEALFLAQAGASSLVLETSMLPIDGGIAEYRIGDVKLIEVVS